LKATFSFGSFENSIAWDVAWFDVNFGWIGLAEGGRGEDQRLAGGRGARRVLYSSAEVGARLESLVVFLKCLYGSFGHLRMRRWTR
jgi:hypothetical protein